MRRRMDVGMNRRSVWPLAGFLLLLPAVLLADDAADLQPQPTSVTCIDDYAAATAAATSSASPSRTRACTAPVQGLKTSPKRGAVAAIPAVLCPFIK